MPHNLPDALNTCEYTLRATPRPLCALVCRGVDGHEELTGLEPIPVHELAMRLMLLYKHRQEHPAVDSITEEDVLGPVSPETVELLCRYLYYADQAYDCGTEDSLKQLLSEDGEHLRSTADSSCACSSKH